MQELGHHRVDPSECFFPTVEGDLFPWHFVGTDWVGAPGGVHRPRLVRATRARRAPPASNVGTSSGVAYNALNSATMRSRPDGRSRRSDDRVRAAYHKQSDTDLHVQSITFGCGAGSRVRHRRSATCTTSPTDRPVDRGHLYSPPTGGGAQVIVRLTAAEQASRGGALGGNSTPAVCVPRLPGRGWRRATSRTGSAGANKGNVFLQNVGEGEQPRVRRQQQRSDDARISGSTGCREASAGRSPATRTTSSGGCSTPSDFFGKLDSATFSSVGCQARRHHQGRPDCSTTAAPGCPERVNVPQARSRSVKRHRPSTISVSWIA